MTINIRCNNYLCILLNNFIYIFLVNQNFSIGKMEMEKSPCSAFYLAYRTGDAETVKKILRNLRSYEISRLEPTGSTALHAASYYGHTELVHLLVSRCCARAVRNLYGLTAFEEAATPEIKQILSRPKETKRYQEHPNDCEWISDNFDGIWKNILHPGRLFECMDDNEEAVKRRQACVIDWLNVTLENEDERNLIIPYFQYGFETNSAERLIKAYTEETDFFRNLNEQLASIRTDEDLPHPELHAPLIIARSFFRCAYYARHVENSSKDLFRVAKYSPEEITKYEEHVGKGPIKTKTFWSTSTSRKAAEGFSNTWNTMLLLKSRDATCRRTLEVSSLSAYPGEYEVLMVPLTCMEVVSVKHCKKGKYEIQLLYWDW